LKVYHRAWPGARVPELQRQRGTGIGAGGHVGGGRRLRRPGIGRVNQRLGHSGDGDGGLQKLGRGGIARVQVIGHRVGRTIKHLHVVDRAVGQVAKPEMLDCALVAIAFHQAPFAHIGRFAARLPDGLLVAGEDAEVHLGGCLVAARRVNQGESSPAESGIFKGGAGESVPAFLAGGQRAGVHSLCQRYGSDGKIIACRGCRNADSGDSRRGYRQAG
jgi:hypothetical protein